ncbi:hypothetical protein [Pseudomonas oryzihabitans]|nr:hypothetical protein [Pseudomonas oryzihabitans]
MASFRASTGSEGVLINSSSADEARDTTGSLQVLLMLRLAGTW